MNFMNFMYFESAWYADSFDAFTDIKILFSRVSVTTEPSHSLFTIRYHKNVRLRLMNIREGEDSE